MPSELLLFLFLVAIAAGWIDAIAGGSGLLSVPALLIAGFDPATAIATNKLQGTVGTFVSSRYFIRKKAVDIRTMKPMILTTFIGAVVGGVLVLLINPAILAWLVPFFLIAVGIYVLVSPHINDIKKKQAISNTAFASVVTPALGFYDGFFGPGAGTFLALAFLSLLGYGLTQATAHAKILNFTSNMASLIVFIAFGNIVWIAGAAMIAGQIIGASLGAKTVLHKGSTLIKPLLVIVCFSLSVYILADRFFNFTS